MVNHKTLSKSDSGWIIWTIILSLILLAIVCGSYLFIRYSIANGVSTATDSFINNYDTAKEETYSHFYDMAFKHSEEKNHVSNDISIIISSVKEKSALEALRVSDVVYITEPVKENS